MKSPLHFPRQRAAFTLIELLTVMAIILVLAGLIINIAGSANYNSAKARATAELKAMETALESYKTDNGTYPPDPFAPTDPSQGVSTALLNPQADFDPTNSKYLLNSEYLYQVLSGFPANVTGMQLPAPTSPTTMTTTYLKFTAQQLHVASDSTDTVATTNSPKMYIIDPFGFSYGYSTILASTIAHNNVLNATTTDTTLGYNPTFDLWSTAGYAPGGKSTPSTMAGTTAAAKYNTLWIKNW